MKLKVKYLGIEAGGKPIVILNKADAEELGIKSLGRVKIRYKNKRATGIVNIGISVVESGEIGIYEEVREKLRVSNGEFVEVKVAEYPKSIKFIREKLRGRRLKENEFYQIVKDVVEGNLTDIEITAFVTALHAHGISIEEAVGLTNSMVKTGETFRLKRRCILDKHSIGGACGDKTSLILVPIIAATGFTIPKTSSRAITSAAGTADRAEVLMPVSLEIEEMKMVVEKTNGCLVWGGALHLAPADDIFIKIEYPLGIDPLLFPSIMSKKKAIGSTHLVIDIPTGRGTKVKTIGDANYLGKDFIELGKRLGIKVAIAITNGEKPIGRCVGPALEAREALEILMRKKWKNVEDQIDKVIDIAAILLKMVGVKNSREVALRALKSGKAEKKMREIIEMQGGDPRVRPKDIVIGENTLDYVANSNGSVIWMDTHSIVEIARLAGAPKDKGAGVYIWKKVGEKVKKGEKIFTIYAEKERKLENVERYLEEKKVVGIGKKSEMLIQAMREELVHEKTFILER
ncbi:MAG: AMP phosphorylase [Candidatus Aenigmarchaeota archaeon]|nr:AMP phosphorylase [Candidatus Aenigmarchaeota archaeon]